MTTKLGTKDIKTVSTNEELFEMIQQLNEQRPSVISVDAEGWALNRNGTLSLLALCWNEQIIYLIDVQVRTFLVDLLCDLGFIDHEDLEATKISIRFGAWPFLDKLGLLRLAKALIWP